MTHSEFSHLLSSLKTLSPEQVRQLRRRMDSQLAPPKKATGQPASKKGNRSKSPLDKPKKPLTRAEFDQHLLAIGLISQLPDTEADFDDPDDVPVKIKGEPLSETIIRERR